MSLTWFINHFLKFTCAPEIFTCVSTLFVEHCFITPLSLDHVNIYNSRVNKETQLHGGYMRVVV